MKNIDTQRLTNLMNWDLRTYKKEYTNMLLAPFAAMLVIALLTSGYLFNYGTDFHVNHIQVNEITPFAILFVMCAMLGVAGRAFQHMMSNQERVAYLMLPASNMEKFLVRVVFRTFIMFGLIIAAVVCATYLFGLLVWIRSGEFVQVVSLATFFHSVLGTDSPSVSTWLCMAMGVMLIWSFFVLGSAYFRRRAVLMTFLCLFAGMLVISAIIGISAGYCIEWFNNISFDHIVTIEFLMDPELLFDIIGNLIILAWLSFNLWYSYRLFCRMQVINNRWNNK